MTGPRRDQHLGEFAAALVDGVLDHDSRDRALAHLVACDRCRTEVEGQRLVKARLAGLTGPACPGTLAAKLASLTAASVGALVAAGPSTDAESTTGRAAGRPADVGDRSIPTTGSDRSDDLFVVVGGRPLVASFDTRGRRAAPRRAGDRGHGGAAHPAVPRPAARPRAAGHGPTTPSFVRRRARRFASTIGGVAAFAACLLVVAAAGSPDRAVPVNPQVETYSVVHQQSTGGMVGADPIAGLVQTSANGHGPATGRSAGPVR